jgi:hypothetical protein
MQSRFAHSHATLTSSFSYIKDALSVNVCAAEIRHLTSRIGIFAPHSVSSKQRPTSDPRDSLLTATSEHAIKQHACMSMKT